MEFASPFATRPHKLGHVRARRVQLQVERDVVRGRIEQVDEPPEDLRR